MNKLDLVSYASCFTAFMLKSKELERSQIKSVILFGSAARGDFTGTSDIDIFIDTKNEQLEGALKRIAHKFYSSRTGQDYALRGIKNRIALSVGNLDEWKLKRSIISDGIVLYGEYKEIPGNLKHYCFFVFDPIKDVAKRNRIIRKLFGRDGTEGLSNKLGIKKISERGFAVPQKEATAIMELFKKEKISYKLFEIWTDSF